MQFAGTLKGLIKKSKGKRVEKHTPHLEWLDRIKVLWYELEEKNNNQRYVQIEDQIRKNKERLDGLRSENLLDLDISRSQHCRLVKLYRKSQRANVPFTIEEKKIHFYEVQL